MADRAIIVPKDRGESTVPFAVLCEMFDAIVRDKKHEKRRKHLHTFLHTVYKNNFFSALRLILPNLDKERGNYNMKEVALAKAIVAALGLQKDSSDADKLLHWRKGGSKAGKNAGNFPLVAAEVLQKRQREGSSGITIKEVNERLDALAVAEAKERDKIIGELINKTNTQEMKWLIMIILKDLKLGISESTVFQVFHPDAQDFFNVTCDLKLLAETLYDRNKRQPRKEIEVGKAVRPQRAERVESVEKAWKNMRGKDLVVECKFDGDRIQVHKNGRDVDFFSRTFINHTEYREGIASVLSAQIIPEKCILDGEMLVWDLNQKRFAEFGKNQSAAKAAAEGLKNGQQLCYVAFDILYDGNTSVIHRPLRERQILLQNAVVPVKYQLEILVPSSNERIDAHRQPDEPLWSKLVSSPEEVTHFFKETVENREEGIVIKDLDSKWEPGDRSSKWMKIKPDYINVGSDLDVLIIGGYYGSGRRGGEVAQFLLGVAERPHAGGYPTRFISFCKVGTGLTDQELEVLRNKLKPYLRRNEKGTKVPSFYTVMNHPSSRPDVWVDQPEKSVILQIRSDIRSISSEAFAAPHSLRFPRIEKVRYDKPWYDCLNVEELEEMVHAGSGVMGTGHGSGKDVEHKAKRARPERALIPLLPAHLTTTNVSGVAKKSTIFNNLEFYFVNYSAEHPKEMMHKLVAENGGSFSMNLSPAVTHIIAHEKGGLRFKGAVAYGDVIHTSWVLDCIRNQDLLPIKPKYYMHLSKATKEAMREQMDEFGDSYFDEFAVEDLQKIFDGMDLAKLNVSAQQLAHYETKYRATRMSFVFRGCVLYFHRPLHSANPDSQALAALAMRRLGLEVSMYGGRVSPSLTPEVTHSIVFLLPGQTIPFRTVIYSVPREERHFLESPKLHVITQSWLEDVIQHEHLISENTFEIRDEKDIVHPVEPLPAKMPVVAAEEEKGTGVDGDEEARATMTRNQRGGRGGGRRGRGGRQPVARAPAPVRRKARGRKAAIADASEEEEGGGEDALGLVRMDDDGGGVEEKPEVVVDKMEVGGDAGEVAKGRVTRNRKRKGRSEDEKEEAIVERMKGGDVGIEEVVSGSRDEFEGVRCELRFGGEREVEDGGDVGDKRVEVEEDLTRREKDFDHVLGGSEIERGVSVGLGGDDEVVERSAADDLLADLLGVPLSVAVASHTGVTDLGSDSMVFTSGRGEGGRIASQGLVYVSGEGGMGGFERALGSSVLTVDHNVDASGVGSLANVARVHSSSSHVACAGAGLVTNDGSAAGVEEGGKRKKGFSLKDRVKALGF